MKIENELATELMFEIAALEERAQDAEDRGRDTIASNMRAKARGLAAELREARKAVN